MDLIQRIAPLLPQAVFYTVYIGVASFVIGSVLGLFVALARLSTYRLLRYAAIGYVSVVRGTPLLIQILLIYYGLPQRGVVISAIPASIVALSINGSAYLSENFRAGVISVDPGQREAAHSLSLNYVQTMRRVILPQAVRIAVPPVGSRFIAIMKDTSLASVITVFELTRAANLVGSATFRYIQAFLVAALVYWVINSVIFVGQSMLERRLARPY